MAIVFLPELKPVPTGATLEDREKLLQEYKDELARLNPHLVHPDGTTRSLWQCLRYLFRGA